MPEIQGLLNNLKNSNWWVRKNSIENLLAYPEDSYLAVLEEWLKDDDALLRNSSMEAYRALGANALKSLVPLLKNRDADLRLFAVNLLGDIKDGAVLPRLMDALNDPDVNVRTAAAEALGKIGDERAVDTLASSFDDIPWIAMAAVAAVGKIGGDNALSVLYKRLEKEEYRGITCAAIEQAGNQYSIKYLAPYVHNSNVQEQALKAMVNIAERENTHLTASYLANIIPLLIDLQRSPQDEVRTAAFIALSWAEDISVLPYFINALNDDRLQEYAINGLISLGKKAVPDIINALKTPGNNRIILAKILSMSGESEALLSFANDHDAEVRTESALAIGRLKTPEAEKALLKLTHDPVEEVKTAALLSLKNLRRTLYNS